MRAASQIGYVVLAVAGVFGSALADPPVPAGGARAVTGSASIRLLAAKETPYVEPPEDARRAGIQVVQWIKGHYSSLHMGYEHPVDGVVRFDDLGAGDYEIEIQTYRHVPVLRAFRVAPGERLDLGDVLLDPGLPVRGRVLDAVGAPVGGAVVRALPAGQGVPAGGYWLPTVAMAPPVLGNTTVTKPDGTFLLEHVGEGRTLLEADTEKLVGPAVEVRVVASLAPVRLRLAQGANVSCLLRTTEGKAGAGERLIAVPLAEDGKPLPTSRALRAVDAAGKAEFRLAPGRWRIALRTFLEGRPTGEVPLGEWVFAEGEERSLDLRMPGPERR